MKAANTDEMNWLPLSEVISAVGLRTWKPSHILGQQHSQGCGTEKFKDGYGSGSDVLSNYGTYMKKKSFNF
jgi:hypothetical protein